MLSFRGQRHRCFGDPASRHDKMEDRRTRSSADEKSRHCRQDEPIEPFPADLCQQITGDAAGPSSLDRRSCGPFAYGARHDVDPSSRRVNGTKVRRERPELVLHRSRGRTATSLHVCRPTTLMPASLRSRSRTVPGSRRPRSPQRGGRRVERAFTRTCRGLVPVPFPYLHRQPEPGQRPDPAQAASQVAEPSVFGTIRAQLITTPGRIACSAHRLVLHLPRRWPWKSALDELGRHALHDPLQATA
jgi:hypothetical protein